MDPLGPENILGLVTGPLTVTRAIGGSRYEGVAKSPLAHTWGDANSGGNFSPHLKFAGYDGVFFTGISEKPVYLYINDGKAELRDAGYLWGKDTYETEDILQAELGKRAAVISIGPAGEKCSLISCIITMRGAAGRSGLVAVMGSKKLKAVVAKGNQKVPIADNQMANKLRKEYVGELKTFFERFTKYGTGGHANTSALNGDAPAKNWGDVGVIDFPDASPGLSGDV